MCGSLPEWENVVAMADKMDAKSVLSSHRLIAYVIHTNQFTQSNGGS